MAWNIPPPPGTVYTDMHRSLLTLLFSGVLLMPLAHADCTSHPITLQQMHDCNRVLLVFAPNPNDAQFQTQVQQLESAAAGFRERDLILVPVLEPGGMARLPQSDLPTATLTPEEEAKARQKFLRHGSFPRVSFRHGNDFQVVLLGKDGAEKSRTGTPIAPEKLFSTIDGMPMRQNEMKHP